MRPKTFKIIILLAGCTFTIGPFDEIDQINKRIGAKLMDRELKGHYDVGFKYNNYQQMIREFK